VGDVALLINVGGDVDYSELQASQSADVLQSTQRVQPAWVCLASDA
jgi:hypothetical protein